MDNKNMAALNEAELEHVDGGSIIALVYVIGAVCAAASGLAAYLYQR